MSRQGGGGSFVDSVLLIVALLLAYTFGGVWLATRFAHTTEQVAIILTPIVGVMLGTVFVVLLIKMYWNRW